MTTATITTVSLIVKDGELFFNTTIQITDGLTTSNIFNILISPGESDKAIDIILKQLIERWNEWKPLLNRNLIGVRTTIP